MMLMEEMRGMGNKIEKKLGENSKIMDKNRREDKEELKKN